MDLNFIVRCFNKASVSVGEAQWNTDEFQLTLNQHGTDELIVETKESNSVLIRKNGVFTTRPMISFGRGEHIVANIKLFPVHAQYCAEINDQYTLYSNHRLHTILNRSFDLKPLNKSNFVHIDLDIDGHDDYDFTRVDVSLYRDHFVTMLFDVKCLWQCRFDGAGLTKTLDIMKS